MTTIQTDETFMKHYSINSFMVTNNIVVTELDQEIPTVVLDNHLTKNLGYPIFGMDVYYKVYIETFKRATLQRLG